VLTQDHTDPRAWQSDTLTDRSAWFHPLPERCLEAVAQAVRQRPPGQPVTQLQASDALRDACAAGLAPARDALEHGTGFVIIEGPPSGHFSADDLQALYWLVGQLLGRPMEQNVQGTLLYDVRDTGQDVRYGARFSVTNAETSFHTDNSFGAEVLDYVGLLCLQPAQSGGLSQLVSAYAAHNELRQRHPDILELLYQPFHVDRRGGSRPGEAPTVRFPIFAWDRAELTCRYLRYWIEVGHEKVGEPLTAEQTRALDVLDEVLNERPLRVEFFLRPGEMFFINNRWLFHNRTAFVDHPEPERRRHYVRLWVRK
jgi:alpha-ketoglutarate-dependent taurine dioxygenase